MAARELRQIYRLQLKDKQKINLLEEHQNCAHWLR